MCTKLKFTNMPCVMRADWGGGTGGGGGGGDCCATQAAAGGCAAHNNRGALTLKFPWRQRTGRAVDFTHESSGQQFPCGVIQQEDISQIF
jgi:hypothetical protein